MPASCIAHAVMKRKLIMLDNSPIINTLWLMLSSTLNGLYIYMYKYSIVYKGLVEKTCKERGLGAFFKEIIIIIGIIIGIYNI